LALFETIQVGIDIRGNGTDRSLLRANLLFGFAGSAMATVVYLRSTCFVSSISTEPVL
jgi:hypothetical protein